MFAAWVLANIVLLVSVSGLTKNIFLKILTIFAYVVSSPSGENIFDSPSVLQNSLNSVSNESNWSLVKTPNKSSIELYVDAISKSGWFSFVPVLTYFKYSNGVGFLTFEKQQSAAFLKKIFP